MDYLLHIQNKNLLFHFSYIDISPMSKGVTLSFPVLSSLQKRKKKKTQNQVFTFSTKPQNLCIITLITIPIYILPTKKKKEKKKKKKAYFYIPYCFTFTDHPRVVLHICLIIFPHFPTLSSTCMYKY